MSYLAEEITQLQFLDRYDHAQTLLDQARADSADAVETLLPALGCAQLWQDSKLGRLDDAEAGAVTLLDLGQQLGTSVHTLDAVIVRTAVALLRGDTDAAAAQLRLVDRLTNADDDVRNPGVAVMRGWLAASRFDFGSAIDALRPVLQGAAASHSYWPLWPCWNGMFFQIGLAAADSAFAASCLTIAEAAAERNPGVATYEGVALTLRGIWQRDIDTLAHAVGALARCPRPMLRALGAESYGRALLADGRRSEGLEHLDQAWDEYHAIGARAFRAGIQRMMHEAGARRVKWSTAETPPATGLASLTEAERRVAALITTGHTNKSAASKLGVSVNTVGTHLRTIFAKLGVRSRVQLANLLHDDVTG